MSIQGSPVHQVLSPDRGSPRNPSPKAFDIVSSVGLDSDKVNDGSVTLSGRPCSRLKTGGWKSAYFFYVIAFTDTFAVVAYASNLAPYLLFNLHLSQAHTANTVTNFIGLAYLLPVFWGFMADQYLGRYLTACLGGFVAVVGAIILTVQAATPKMLPPFCPLEDLGHCSPPSQNVLSLFQAGLFLVAVGSGGVKPCIASMGHEQFDDSNAVENKQRTQYFTGFYVAINGGAILGVTLLTWIVMRYGWTKGFGAIAGICFVGMAVFLLGTPVFRHRTPTGSVITRLAQVVVAAFRNYTLELPQDSSELYELSDKESARLGIRKVAHTDRLRFFDRAAAIKRETALEELHPDGPWHLCTVTQVEDFKTMLALLPIWATNWIVYTLFAQITAFTVQQALSLDRHLGPGKFMVPAPSFGFFLLIAALFAVFLWEYLVVPIARRFTGRPSGISDLQRTGLGLALAALSMLVAGVVETKRVKVINDNHLSYVATLNPDGGVPMKVWYLLPQYMILGCVEAIVGVAQLNFFTREIPEGMKGFGTALYFSSVAMGYFLSSVLVDVVNLSTDHAATGLTGWLQPQGFLNGGLAKFYFLLAVVSTLNTIVFVFFAYFYVPKKLEPLDDNE